MRKQYYLSEPATFKCRVTLYHDGVKMNQVEMWFGDKLNEYLENIEANGYTQGYSKREVDDAENKFKYLRDNLIEGV